MSAALEAAREISLDTVFEKLSAKMVEIKEAGNGLRGQELKDNANDWGYLDAVIKGLDARFGNQGKGSLAGINVSTEALDEVVTVLARGDNRRADLARSAIKLAL